MKLVGVNKTTSKNLNHAFLFIVDLRIKPKFRCMIPKKKKIRINKIRNRIIFF